MLQDPIDCNFFVSDDFPGRCHSDGDKRHDLNEIE